jgi:aryl-alcohol dehydrogenase-like predicted oxidoreductase
MKYAGLGVLDSFLDFTERPTLMSAKENPSSPSADSGRRQFLKNLGAVGAGAALSGSFVAHAQAPTNPPGRATGQGIPRRPFGRTGVPVSIIGVGGHAIGTLKTEADAVRLIQEAMDAGVNFMDNAWEYHDGRSEEWMGKALKGRRDESFLMTKVCTHGRDAMVAMEQLEQSLRRLQTDHLDLWQIHEVIYESDPDLHFARGGVIEALEQAKKQGKTRFVGFTGHKDPAIHLKMLSHKFPFDACQMPLGPFDATFRSFEQKVLPELNRQGIAPIGMKSLNGTAAAVKQGIITAHQAISYVLSLPIATLVSGMDSVDVLRKNLETARTFAPMDASAMQALREKCASVAADGRFELYKTSMRFDGPPGRKQHGFPSQEEMPG